MNRGVPFGTALKTFSRAVGQGERAPIEERRDGRPELPDADSSNLSGWLQNFGARFRNTSDVPHEAPTWNPGMERYATETMFPDSGTAGFRPDPTPEEQAANRAAMLQFGRDVLFGPERGSVIPFVDEASNLERLIRDWGLSEQEFRLSGEALSERRFGAGIGWGTLGVAASVPVFGQVGRGLVKAGRAAAKAADRASDAAAAARGVAETGQDLTRAGRASDISEDLATELRSGSVNYTAPAERLSKAGDYQRDTVEIIHRQGFNEPPTVVSRSEFDQLRNSDDYIPIYRGVRDYEGISAQSFVDEFAQGEFFIGTGALGNGSYFTTSPNLADAYRDGGQIIEALIPRNARLFDLDASDARQLLSEKPQVFRDLSDYLAAKGYDGLITQWGAEKQSVVLYNRSAVIVPESGQAGRVGGEAAQVARQIPEGRWAENPNAEQVSTDWLQQFVTHDRALRSTSPAYGRDQVDTVKRQLLERGFDEPLILDVAADGRAILFDGNHRLAAAMELGLESVPVRVVTSRAGAHAGEGAEIAVREGLAGGKLLKPSEVFTDLPAAARTGAEAAQMAGRERVSSSRRFDADEAMFGDPSDWDWLREPNPPDKAYHVAPRSARESIDQRGLDPDTATWNTGAGQNQEWWDDAIWERLGDAGEMIPIEYRPEGVYMFGDLAEAQRYARGGGDIYEVDVRRLIDDGGDFIRDPSTSGNWEFLDPSEYSFVTRVAPEDYIRRIEEVPGTGLDDMIRAERSRIRNILAPEEQLSSGVVVPRYGDTAAARQAFDEFTSMPPVIPQMQRLNRQWMDVADDTLMHYQVHLLSPQAQIVDELGALAHWQYVGNNNIQALLRTGRMPVHDSYEQAVLDLMGMYQVPRSQIDAVFTTRAQEAMPLLDNLISTSNTHGGFVGYRGVDRASLNAAFGDDFYIAMATDPQSLIGKTWTDRAYSATSLDPVRAREFAWGEKPTAETMGVLFRVTVPNGVGAAPVNGYLNPYSPRFQNEFEMLIGRDTTFRITEVVTPMDQAELINPKWFNTFWDEASGTYAHLRTDTIPVVHIEVVP